MSEDRFWKRDSRSRVINILCFHRYQRQDLNSGISDKCVRKTQDTRRRHDPGCPPDVRPPAHLRGASAWGAGRLASQPGEELWPPDRGLVHPLRQPVRGRVNGLSFPLCTDGDSQTSAVAGAVPGGDGGLGAKWRETRQTPCSWSVKPGNRNSKWGPKQR